MKMTKFVKVTESTGDDGIELEAYVNMERVCWVMGMHDGAFLQFSDGDVYMTVNESPEEILFMMGNVDD